MVDIRTNLLKNRPTLSEKDYQKERRILRFSVFGLVIAAVVAIAFSIWNFLLAQQLAGLDAQVKKSTQDVQGYTQASTQQLYLKSRLKLITVFLVQRTVAREALQRIFLTTIPGTHISSVTFPTTNIVTVQVSANTAGVLTDVLHYYQADDGYFIQVYSEGITRTKEGTYQLTLDLTLPKAGT